MKRFAAALALLFAAMSVAFAQNVTVIGPVTPGNIPQFNSQTVIKDSGNPGGSAAFANPTGAVGLTTVNGSANTAMRSDAAPPLSASVQSALTSTINQVLTGTGAFGFGSITNTQLTALINPFTSGLSGAVPASGGGTTNFLRADGTFAAPGSSATGLMPSGGRLTTSSGVCVPTTDIAAATVIYLAPCVGPNVLIYNGTAVQAYNFTSGVTDTVGLTLTLGSNWAASTLYDVYATLNTGSPVLCTVAWTSSGAGTSARATALATYAGMQTNATLATCRISNSATISMAANQGTFEGTFITNGSTGQIDFKFGTSAAGGGAAVAGIWNMYNRTPGAFFVNDTNANFSTTATSTFQPLDISGTGSGLNNRITFVTGTGTDPIDSLLTVGCQPATSNTCQFGVGINTTSGITSRCVTWLTGVGGVVGPAPCRVYAPVGLNYAQAIMWSSSNSSIFISATNGGLTAGWWW